MTSASKHRPIAIVGMACRLPGASNLEAYWHLIRDGKSTAAPLPENRFERALYYHPEKGTLNKSYTDLGCVVDYDYVSPLDDELPEIVKNCPEVTYRVLGSVAAEALADARMLSPQQRTRNAGVYLGHTRNSGLAGDICYGTMVATTARWLCDLESFRGLGPAANRITDEIVAEIRRELPHRDARGGPSLGAGVAASLISLAFGLSGPSMSFNSACASSLNALCHGVRALQLGRIDMAVVGGASYCHHDTLVMFSQAQSLSASGTRPFDADADGLVVGEGYAAIVLKTLDDALRDGDPIRGVIRGIGMSSDGKGKSLWAPRREGQIEAIHRAYEGGLENSCVQYVEAHATSTALGDATEVAALAAALPNAANRKIPLGGVKGNIGHTLETAGLCGIIKVALCMQYQTIPPVANLRQPNDKTDWDASPFYLPRTAQPWPAPLEGEPRRAAVSAFGIGGLNVHVVLDEFASERKPSRVPRPSAKPSGKSSADDAVAIVGRGVVLPGALSVAQLAEMLAAQTDPKSEIDSRRWDPADYLRREEVGPYFAANTLAGQIQGFAYDWRKHKIPPKQIANASPLQFMILDAVDQAFQEANIDAASINRKRVGAIVGNTFGGEFANQLLMGLRIPDFQRRLAQRLRSLGLADAEVQQHLDSYRDVLLERMPALLDETGSFTSSSLASRITKSFDLMGGGVAVDAGNCSFSAALACCRDLLVSGDCHTMVCVGAQEDLGVTRFEAWGLAGILAKHQAKSPFDVAADGSLPGEGAAAVVLMRLADAQAQGKKVYGIIRGIGTATSPALDEATTLAVRRAFGDAALDAAVPVEPNDIAQLESTTLGTRDRVALELAGIDAAYRAPRRKPLFVDAVATQIGHTGSCSAAAATIKATLDLDALEAAATFGLERLSEDAARLSGIAVHRQREPIEVANREGRVLYAVQNSGFKTEAYHILIERGTKAPRPTFAPETCPRTEMFMNAEIIDGIRHFDATQFRRTKMKDKAASGAARPALAENIYEPAIIVPSRVSAPPEAASEVAATPTSLASSQAASTVSPHVTNGHAANGYGKHKADHIAATSAPAPAAPIVARKVWQRDELQQFLVNFVVEQTGYPPEIVEMDADLEADLGIDSIKKAQLFGELREHFAVTPDESLTLDDFPTLTHIADYLLRSASQGDSVTTAKPVVSVAANDAPVAEMAKHAPVAAAPVMPPAQEPAVPAKPRMSQQALHEFLVNFVVEQTGYPPEIVEMDADLEADLGIDSIKKAQLFGELREHFDVQADETLTLDDFPTLRHVAEFLQRAPNVAPSSVAQSSVLPSPTTAPPAATPKAPAAQAVAAHPASPRASHETSRPIEAAASTHGSATTFATASTSATATVKTAKRWNAAELEGFLINFVVEQTGYPPEIVEMDADLEADLGIDSIKKAQLFGELREHFDLTADEALTLDDFPTLRHVFAFIARQLGISA
jgi:acyl transferase domain-containing protein/acyl carrier protein